MSKTITIRLNKEEEMIMDKLSKMYNCGISTALKRLALEKLEDEYDRKVADEYYKEVKNGTVETVSFEEFEKTFNL